MFSFFSLPSARAASNKINDLGAKTVFKTMNFQNIQYQLGFIF